MLATDISIVLFFCAQVLFVFSAFIFAVSAIDDFFIDAYFYLFLSAKQFFQSNKQKTKSLSLTSDPEKFIAIMLPAWQESDVIAKSVTNLIKTIEYDNYHVFIGTYPNDWRTQIEVNRLALKYQRVHKVVTDLPGPTCKADCLNSIIKEILMFERVSAINFSGFVLQDAEDIIHNSSLKVFSHYLTDYDLVQIPVYSLPRKWSNFTGGHYMDEFAEFQGKEIRVREMMAKVVPGAGVGTAYSRRAVMYFLNKSEVFNTNTLTEDYEFSLRLHEAGFKQVFARVRLPLENDLKPEGNGKGADSFIATREYFPSKFWPSVRQKTRWTIGISLQGWKNYHWRGNWRIRYFFWRDRKMLFFAHAIAAGFFSLGLFGALNSYHWLFFENYEFAPLLADESYIWYVVYFNLFMLAVRIVQRCYWTYSLYGWSSLLFLPVRYMWGSLINYLAITRAIKIFISHSIQKKPIGWDKTAHDFPDEIQPDIEDKTAPCDDSNAPEFVIPKSAGHPNHRLPGGLTLFSLILTVLLILTPQICTGSDSGNILESRDEASVSSQSSQKDQYYRKRLEEIMSKKSFINRQWRLRRSYSYVQKGTELALKGKNEEAIKTYDRYLAADPKHLVMQWDRLKLTEKAKGPQEIEKSASALIAQAPDFGPAYILRAFALKKLQRWQEAEKDWRTARKDTKLVPKDQEVVLAELLNATYHRGKIEDALTLCETLLIRHPGSTKYLVFHAGLLEKSERWKDALGQWQKILKMDTDKAIHRQAVLACAMLMQTLNKKEEAFALLNQARKAKLFETPDTAEAQRQKFYLILAQLAESVGWIEIALTAYEKTAPGHQNSAARLNLARLNLLNNAPDKALELILAEPQISFQEDNALTELFDLIHLFISKNHLAKAVALVEKVLPEIKRISPQTLQSENGIKNQNLVLMDLLFSSYKRNNLTETLNLCDQLLNCQPDAIQYYVFRARVLEKMNRWEEAATQWGKIIMMKKADAPTRREAVLASAVLLQKTDKPQQALFVLKNAHIKGLFELYDTPLAQRQRFYLSLALLSKNSVLIDAAVNAYEKMPPNYLKPSARLDLAHLYILNGQPAKVPNLLSRPPAIALEQEPTLTKILNLLHLLVEKEYLLTARLLEQKAFPAAEKVFLSSRRSKKLDDLWCQYLELDANLAAKNRRFKQAESALARLTELTGNYNHQLKYAAILIKTGNIEKAILILAKTSQRSDLPPYDRAQAYALLASALATQNRFKKAAEAWHQAYLWDGNPAHSLFSIDAWQKAGDLTTARAAVEQFPIEKLSLKNQLIYYETAAHIWQQCGDLEKSMAAWQKAVHLAPRPLYYYQISDLLLSQNRLDAANYAIDNALKISPYDQEGLKRRAYIQMRLGNDHEAAYLLENSLKFDDGAQYQRFADLGFAYARIAENDKALNFFNQAMDQALKAQDNDSQIEAEKNEDLSAVRSQIAELDRSVELSLTESVHFMQQDGTRLNPSSQNWFNMGLGMLEVSYRPPKIGYRNGRTLALTGRLMWPNELNSAKLESEFLQAGLGLKYKPLEETNLFLASEYLFGLGSRMEDQVLLHVAHSHTHLPQGFSRLETPGTLSKYFPYWQIYTNAGRVFQEDNQWFVTHESRLGSAVKSQKDIQFFSFGYLQGNALFYDNDDFFKAEAGLGFSFHLPWLFDRYKGYRSKTECLLRGGYIFHDTYDTKGLSALLGLRVSFF